MDAEEFKIMSATVTEAASLLRSAIKAPIVLVIACSSDAEEPLLLGLACSGSVRDADSLLVDVANRTLKAAETRMIGNTPPGKLTIGGVGKDGKITKAPEGDAS